MFSKLFRKKDTQPATPKPAGIYLGLREQFFHLKPDDLDISRGEVKDVLGVLMETGYPQGVATLLALADGTASLYFSSGGGVLGGGETPEGAKAARAFIAAVGAYRAEMTVATQFPLPKTGQVRFYVLTMKDGVLTAEASEDDLGNKRVSLSGLFYAGHAVISQLRMISERKAGEKG